MNIKEICKNIKSFFKDKKTDFGENLFNKVKEETSDFNKNLRFFDLIDKIDKDYLDYILYFYCKENKNLFFLIVWPITYNFDKIIKDCYNQYGNIIFKKEIKLNDNGIINILNLISDKANHSKGKELWFAEPHRNINPLTIYLFETKELNVKENEKIDYLVKIFNNNKNHILNIQKSSGINNLYCTTKAKRECRELLKKNDCVSPISFAPDKNYSHHVNDEHWETIEMSRVFFNDNSIYAINHCDFSYKCESFNNKYIKYFNFINNNKWGDINDFCLNNSSILSQFGIRQSRDIDYLHNVSFNINKQIPEEEISSHNYVVKSECDININDLIYNPKNHFWYKNIKFCTLNKLLEFKKKQKNNGKAKNDILLIEKFIN